MSTAKTGLQSRQRFRGKWETKLLGDIASIRNQKVLPSNVNASTPCVELEHIRSGNGQLLERATAENSISSKYHFLAGDVLFGRLRSYLRKFWLADQDGICTTEIWPLMVDPKQLDSRFLHAIVQSDQFFAMANISYGTHMPRADWGVISNLPIMLPGLQEQRAIAEVLSDVDGLLNALEALIAKKQAIKQATMQQLLTGKTRLPGFSGAWELGILANFGIFRSGSGFPLAFQGHQSGDYPFFKVSDLSGEGNQLFMNKANHYISEDVRKKLGAIRFESGSIVFAKIGAAIFLERKRLLSQESCLDNNMMAFTLTNDLACPRFFHYIFLRIELGKLVSATALPALSGRHIGAVSISIPPLSEQRVIAAVLSDMDAEIAALEERRDKTHAIKQGMMQQLLTGRVRLSESRICTDDTD